MRARDTLHARRQRGPGKMAAYKFTANWFDITTRGVWDQLIPQLKPKRILEVGCYEGAGTCYLIDNLAGEGDMEIHCVDAWERGAQTVAAEDFAAIEGNFHNNIQLAMEGKPRVRVATHKEFSDIALSRMIAEGKKNYFDFVYIDASHLAPDVICDAVLGFKLLRVGGCMAFDDYLWAESLPGGKDPLRCPKPAVDAFINLNIRKLEVLPYAIHQIYLRKTSD